MQLVVFLLWILWFRWYDAENKAMHKKMVAEAADEEAEIY